MPHLTQRRHEPASRSSGECAREIPSLSLKMTCHSSLWKPLQGREPGMVRPNQESERAMPGSSPSPTGSHRACKETTPGKMGFEGQRRGLGSGLGSHNLLSSTSGG